MILYLGLNPPPGVFHYPVIRTEKLDTPELQRAKELWPSFTHVIFTSQTAVRYWDLPLDGKTVIAIGEATASALSVPSVLAPSATQEGVIALLESLNLRNAYLFLPHSKRSRPNLEQYLIEKGISHFVLDLYDTVFQKPLPVPDLSLFDEIVFTSPSTVEGFLEIYGKLPLDKKLTSIGPVTEKKISESIRG